MSKRRSRCPTDNFVMSQEVKSIEKVVPTQMCVWWGKVRRQSQVPKVRVSWLMWCGAR